MTLLCYYQIGISQDKKKRIQTAVEEAEAKAKAEGLEQGRAEVYQQIAEWNERRKAAEARGEPFTEPPPGMPQNGSER